MSFRAGLKSVVLAVTIAAPFSGVPFLAPLSFASAQQSAATVHGTVTDPSGAVIPGATVTFTPATGKAILATSQSDGTFALTNVPPGLYSETVTMPGFASFVKLNLRIAAGQAVTADAKLAIQEQSQEVNVTAEGATVSTDPDSNASSTVISGKDLDALSDDPDELSDELTALAGPAVGPNGGQIYVDGFTGGQLPPKSSIREIRINQNPFSAQYDKPGYGRVEVFTKPGGDKLHGSFQMSGNANFLNTSNPFLGDTPQLPYHTLYMLGNFTGPLSSKASFSVGGSHRDIEQNTIFEGTLLAASASATTPCPPGTPEAPSTCGVYTAAIPVFYPQTRTDFTPRIDLQLSEKNTLTTRYQFETSTAVNDGTGGFDLPSAAFNLTQTENTLQMTDTQIISPRIINETRFEYQRDLSAQIPLSNAPSVNVQGSFDSGGSTTQLINDHQDHFEVQNYTSIQLKKNFIRMGGRFRSTSDSQYTNSGSNQTFTYSCLVDTPATPTTPSSCPADSNGVVSAYNIGQAAEYSYTDVVHGSTQATLADLGVYAEDDWKPVTNLTISYGFRYETENYMSDHHDFAPRLSFAWGVGKKSSPQTVIRGGFGIFYERFTLTNVVTTRQQNGTNFLSTIVRDPSANCSPSDPSACSPCNPTSASSCTGSTLLGLQTYSLDPNLRTPYIMQSSLGVDEQLGKLGTLSLNYQNAHGVHEFNSIDENLINSTPEFVNGVPVAYGYRFQSEGLFNQSQFSISPRINYGHGLSLWGYYVLNFANSDTSGAGDFPSQPGNLRADYGRASFDVRNRLFTGGSFTFPHLITFSPFLVASSGQPFNIYTGTDLNGDGQLNNDRPAYATTATLKPVTTKYGVFDLNPSSGAARIPVNLGKGPSLISFNLRIAKVFGFGGEIAHDQGDNHGSPGGPGSHRGGGGGGGGGPFGSGVSSGRRYNLSIGLQAANLFNDVDLSPPNGNLTSPQFGQSTQLAGGFYTTNSALRRITLQSSFSF
jgi:Carboxypeptidase regulatory-like domain